MHYYQILRNGVIIDTYSGVKLTYVKYQEKHRTLLLCNQTDAEGIIADSGKCYHINTLLPFPVDDYLTADIEEISEIEYERLKERDLKTADEIRADLLNELIERGAL